MKRKTRVLLAVVTASFAASVLSETIVAYPNEKNSGVTVNGEKVGDAKYGDGWTFMNGVLALNVARDYTLAGTNTKGVVRIDVNANATVTLDSLRSKTAGGKKHGGGDRPGAGDGGAGGGGPRDSILMDGVSRR